MIALPTMGGSVTYTTSEGIHQGGSLPQFNPSIGPLASAVFAFEGIAGYGQPDLADIGQSGSISFVVEVSLSGIGFVSASASGTWSDPSGIATFVIPYSGGTAIDPAAVLGTGTIFLQAYTHTAGPGGGMVYLQTTETITYTWSDPGAGPPPVVPEPPAAVLGGIAILCLAIKGGKVIRVAIGLPPDGGGHEEAT